MEPSQPGSIWRRLADLAVLWILLLLPFKVVALGWRPVDDAMRHVGKVLSGKSWGEILVLRPEVTVDPAAGWHAILGLAHRAGIGSATGLLIFSVVVAALTFLLVPLAFTRRWDAWAASLAIVALTAPLFWKRLMFGRPYLVSMVVLGIFAWLWPRLKEAELPRAHWLGLTLSIAAATWIHGSWYLFLLPLGACLLAREERVALRFASALLTGVTLGALVTGSPIAFLKQTTMHPIWALETRFPQRVLVGEFQPSGGELYTVMAVLGLVALRKFRAAPALRLDRDPIFLLACLGWALGLHTLRFFYDWGLPAALVWMAREIAVAWPEATDVDGARRRCMATLAVLAVLYLAVTADTGGRWSSARDRPFLHADNPRHAPWLPAPGGILYSNTMRVFYNQFFKNPRAPWRYMVGFEPALMPPRDVGIFRTIQLEYSSDTSFLPWIERMRPEDRLVIIRSTPGQPKLPQLEWHSPYRGMWIGRLPAAPRPSPTPPPT